MRILFFTFLLSLIALVSSSQHLNILISNINDPEEPSIMFDPENPQFMVAGANLNNVYYSNDYGYSWLPNILESDSFGVWGDPVIAVDTAGDFYFLHLSNPVTGSWIDRIVCQKSTDKGITWNNGSYMGLNGTKAQDKQWISIDRSNNNMYVTWTQFDEYGSADYSDSSSIMFSKSLDAGTTWSPAKRINKLNGDCIDDDFTVEGAVPAVGPDGQIYVGWVGPEGIMFDRSFDQGETWLESDILVSDFPGGWTFNVPGIYRCNGLPVTVCDTSNSAYRGNIYINWADQRNGTDDTDIWMAKSSDGGNTWSAPIRVNDDEPGKHQFFTWTAIDQANGYIYVVFYDRRNYSDTKTDVYMARSTDGGETFTNFVISDSPFSPNPAVFFGDYTNIFAYNDIVRPIWTRLSGSSLSVLTAIIDVNAVESAQPETYGFNLDQNYPNPFDDQTFFSFKLHKRMNVSLKVFDLYGKLIATIVDNSELDYGKYKFGFNFRDYNLPSGVYYFSLVSDEKTLIRKMIIQR